MDSALDKLIDGILHREDRTGTGVVTNDPADSGGRTQWGITEKDNPDLWADGVVTKDEARARYIQRYVLPFQGIEDPHLLHQVVDWGVMSGPKTVIKILQQLVGVKADGVLGPVSLKAINFPPPGQLFGYFLPGRVALALAVRDARVIFMATLAKRRPKDLKFLLGWLHRTQEFK